MDSFENPIGSQRRDPYENYKIEPVELDKKEKEKFEGEGSAGRPKKWAVAAFLAVQLQRFADYIQSSLEKGLTAKEEAAARENLLAFKAALETLKSEDRGEDANFLNRLADFWHMMAEDSRRLKKNTPLAVQFSNFIQSLKDYPPQQEHTLGYYLMEHAGEKWIPFPYMELIHRLHADHQKTPASSPLNIWTKQLDQMIDQLQIN